MRPATRGMLLAKRVVRRPAADAPNPSPRRRAEEGAELGDPQREPTGTTGRTGGAQPPVRDREDHERTPDELPGYTPQARTDHEEGQSADPGAAPGYTPDGDLGT